MGRIHEITLTELQPGTRYFFTIGTAKKRLQSGSFQTKGTAAAPAEPEKKPPLLQRLFKKNTPPAAPAAAPAPQEPAKPAATGAAAPPTWKTWGDPDSLQDHFVRHGKDFGARSADDYAAQAWRFLQRAIDEGLPVKLDESDGTLRVWDGRTKSFAAYNRNFTTKTYFKPNSPDYFQRQPGKSVKLRRPDPKS